MEEFERPGYFWLPEDRGNKEVAGTLSYSFEDGLVLRLMGTLEEPRTAYDPQGEHSPSLIQGITEDSKEWTLRDCLRTNFTLSSPGYSREEYSAHSGLRGLRFGGEEAIVFDQVTLGFSRLPDWAGRTVWKQEMDFQDTDSGFATVTGLRVEYTEPDPIEFELPDHGMHVKVSHSWGTGGDRLRTVNLTHDVAFRIRLDEFKDLDAIRSEVVQPLQNFMTLATSHPNSVTRLSVANDAYFLELSNGKRQTQPAEVYFSQRYIDRREKTLLEPWMLFSMRELNDRFPIALGNWLSVSSELDTVCQLIFAGDYEQSPYLEYTFLALAQAAESYHRERIGGTAYTEEDHRARVEAIVSAIPDDLRSWTRDKLRYTNELTFRKRLTELLARVGPVMDFVGDRKQFVDKLTCTRNYLVHRTEELKRQAATGLASYYLTQAFRYMLRASLMLDSGFSADEVARMYDENQHFIQFRVRYLAESAGAGKA